MATLTQIRNKADAVLSTFWDALAIKQEAYHLKHGKYFQLVVTSPVVDGADTTFEVIHPSDEAHMVDVGFSFNSPIPFKINVDTWGDTPSRGYRATAIVELLDGRKFTCSRSLTDTRVWKQDYTGTDVGDQTPVGVPYYFGDAPIVATTPWEEIIVEQI